MTNPRAVVLYDDACPFCAAEIGLLRRWDRERVLRTVDISAPEFRSEDWGIPMSALSSRTPIEWPRCIAISTSTSTPD